MKQWVGCLLLFVTSCLPAWGEVDIPAGKAIATTTCAACHNPDGNSTQGLYPKLAGQHAGYLADQLKEFRLADKGKRNSAIMGGMVMNLSDQDILNVTAYYAQQKPTSGQTAENLLAKGQQIYRAGNAQSGVPACMACHGVHGQGNAPANFPAVSGQHAQYLTDQLEGFRSGKRANDPNDMMQMIAKKLSKEEIEAVSSYMSGLH